MTAHAFLVPVLDRWLLFSPLAPGAALVNEGIARALQSGRTARVPEPVLRLCDAAQRRVPEPRPQAGELCPSMLGIIPTRGCNIGCVYCNFGGPTAAMVHMDPRIAVAAVDFVAERLVSAGRRRFPIHFFGGEPFASPDIVDVVVHRARMVGARLGLAPYFDASTNGVFSEERCRWIGDYFDGIVLSFDGPAEYHDRNRPAQNGRGTFEAVSRTAKRLSETPLDLCLRVCVTEDSVTRIEEIVRWMVAEYTPAVINLETLTPGPLAERAGLRVPNPYNFARHCVGAYRLGRELGVRVVYSAAEHEKARLSFCPVGSDSMIVSPDGRVSACYLLPQDWQERGLELDVGEIGADGYASIDWTALERVRRVPVRKPRCERCFCRWTCAGGCHVNQTYPGCEEAFTDFCLQTRVVTACLVLMDLGCESVVDELLADHESMRRLAEHDWDPIVALDARGYRPAPRLAEEPL